jgi:cytochrome d ubiquinol oxidase subunit I
MQNPVGYGIENGRAVMTDFFALLTNPNVLYQFPHVLSAGITLAGFVVLAFSAWHILNKSENKIFRTSFPFGAIYSLIGVVVANLVGHFQGQFLVQHQPLKMSAAEALWETQQPAALALVAGIDEANKSNTFEIAVPGALSFMSYNNFTGEVKGLNQIQEDAGAQYGEGNYIPPVALAFWSFRIMVGAGLLMALLALLAVVWSKKDGILEKKPAFLKILVFSPLLAYLASTFGWILTEVGRWPWIVYGLQKIEDAVSPNVPAWNVLVSIVLFSILYTVLSIVALRLALKQGKKDVSLQLESSAH